MSTEKTSATKRVHARAVDHSAECVSAHGVGAHQADCSGSGATALDPNDMDRAEPAVGEDGAHKSRQDEDEADKHQLPVPQRSPNMAGHAVSGHVDVLKFQLGWRASPVLMSTSLSGQANRTRRRRSGSRSPRRPAEEADGLNDGIVPLLNCLSGKTSDAVDTKHRLHKHRPTEQPRKAHPFKGDDRNDAVLENVLSSSLRARTDPETSRF